MRLGRLLLLLAIVLATPAVAQPKKPDPCLRTTVHREHLDRSIVNG